MLAGASSAEHDACVFCAIVAGQAEVSTVCDDPEVLAFLTLSPVTPGHLLVIPKAHTAYLEGLDEDLGAQVFRVAHRLSRALYRSDLRCDAVNLFLADGEAAGEEVFHVHLHVFARFAGDSFRVDADWRSADRSELDSAAQRVRDGLARLAGGSPGRPPLRTTTDP